MRFTDASRHRWPPSLGKSAASCSHQSSRRLVSAPTTSTTPLCAMWWLTYVGGVYYVTVAPVRVPDSLKVILKVGTLATYQKCFCSCSVSAIYRCALINFCFRGPGYVGGCVRQHACSLWPPCVTQRPQQEYAFTQFVRLVKPSFSSSVCSNTRRVRGLSQC